MALERELRTYNDHFEELLPHAGQYVLIHGSDIVSFYAAYEDAITEGYRQFHLQPFMVKQIQRVGEAAFISRHITPQPSL